MSTIGLPEILVIIFPIAIYGGIIYFAWKFYQLLSRINDNVAGIRQAIERKETSGPDLPV